MRESSKGRDKEEKRNSYKWLNLLSIFIVMKSIRDFKVDEIVSFTNNNLQESDTWKGKVSAEFWKFLQMCIQNFSNSKNANKNVCWESAQWNNQEH